MKEKYKLIISVGIDIAKLNHFASAFSSENEILIEPFKFKNDADEFHLLIFILDSLDKNSTIIGLELTAHHGNNLVRYLCKSTTFARLIQIKSTHTLLLIF